MEYKAAVPKDSAKYMKTVVAYANGRGSKIIFGVDDKTLKVLVMDTDSVFQTINAIASAFAYMKIIEKWGSGIPRILRECS